eukprot:TRINITY_DN5400_c0_g2_i1.p1 TRINITY_DN5400_c0_g2~~TRINITY_DN5400_c0_g2_i1.p1  ORF type:complete len:265 (-),score=-23.59 TRINITY_DN5400_c0_g2_i1:527-1321(-)
MNSQFECVSYLLAHNILFPQHHINFKIIDFTIGKMNPFTAKIFSQRLQINDQSIIFISFLVMYLMPIHNLIHNFNSLHFNENNSQRFINVLIQLLRAKRVYVATHMCSFAVFRYMCREASHMGSHICSQKNKCIFSLTQNREELDLQDKTVLNYKIGKFQKKTSDLVQLIVFQKKTECFAINWFRTRIYKPIIVQYHVLKQHIRYALNNENCDVSICLQCYTAAKQDESLKFEVENKVVKQYQSNQLQLKKLYITLFTFLILQN